MRGDELENFFSREEGGLERREEESEGRGEVS